jgi:hypothetical protein
MNTYALYMLLKRVIIALESATSKARGLEEKEGTSIMARTGAECAESSATATASGAADVGCTKTSATPNYTFTTLSHSESLTSPKRRTRRVTL